MVKESRLEQLLKEIRDKREQAEAIAEKQILNQLIGMERLVTATIKVTG